MSYSGVKERSRKRFNEVNTLLNYLKTLEPTDVMEEVPLEVKIMKGLFYVHLYAAFEKSINDLVETSISLISSDNIEIRHFEAPILSIVLSDKVKSLRDINAGKALNSSINLFVKAASKDVVPLNETAFSQSLQNVWLKTLVEVGSAFGIQDLGLLYSEKVTIDEVVDRRNAVAHGRDSAAAVGERFRVDVLRDKTNIISNVAHKLTTLLEINYSNKKHIKATFKRHYKV